MDHSVHLTIPLSGAKVNISIKSPKFAYKNTFKIIDILTQSVSDLMVNMPSFAHFYKYSA